MWRPVLFPEGSTREVATDRFGVEVFNRATQILTEFGTIRLYSRVRRSFRTHATKTLGPLRTFALPYNSSKYSIQYTCQLDTKLMFGSSVVIGLAAFAVHMHHTKILSNIAYTCYITEFFLVRKTCHSSTVFLTWLICDAHLVNRQSYVAS